MVRFLRWPLLCLPLLAVLSVLAFRAADTRQRSEAAIDRLAQVCGELDELRGLQNEQQKALIGARPSSDVLHVISDILDKARVDASCLRRVDPGAPMPVESASDGPEYRRESVRVQLEPLTLPQLGAVLAAWARTGTPWNVAEVELTAVTQQRLQQPHYAVTLTVSALYVATRRQENAS